MEEENKKESKSWAVTSLVTGILSICLFLAPYFGLPLGIMAIVGNYKQNKIAKNGMGLAGMICGIIGVILNCITGFMLLIALLVTVNMGGGF